MVVASPSTKLARVKNVAAVAAVDGAVTAEAAVVADVVAAAIAVAVVAVDATNHAGGNCCRAVSDGTE